jgi:hypothetical protein
MSGGQSGARSSASGTGGTRRRCRCPGELHLPVARAPPLPTRHPVSFRPLRATRTLDTPSPRLWLPRGPALRLHPVSGKFPDGSEPDSDERAQNEDIMKQTGPVEPQPEPEPEPEPDNSTRQLLVLCFILAVAYLASVGELEPLWLQAQPHLEALLTVVKENVPTAKSTSDGE